MRAQSARQVSGSIPLISTITDTVIDTIVSITVSFFVPEKTLKYGGFYGQRVQTASADLGMEDFQQTFLPFYASFGESYRVKSAYRVNDKDPENLYSEPFCFCGDQMVSVISLPFLKVNTILSSAYTVTWSTRAFQRDSLKPVGSSGIRRISVS